MIIRVNGGPRDITPDTSVRDLMDILKLKPELCAVQLNDAILDKHDIGTTMLTDGDAVEFIRIVGGG